MRTVWGIILIFFCMIGFAGCGSAEALPDGNTEEQGKIFQTVKLVETKSDPEESGFWIEAELEPVSSDAFSQQIRDEMAEEWQKFNALSPEEQMASSHFPGHCSSSFETWEECVAFLGIPLENPLEDVSWLTDADHSAIPLDADNLDGQRQHAYIEWFGTEKGEITSANVCAGYLDGEISVAVTATIYSGGSEEAYSTGSVWAEKVIFETETVSMENGNSALRITPIHGEEYCSEEAFFVQENVLYSIHVVGEKDAKDEVRETMEKVLRVF